MTNNSRSILLNNASYFRTLVHHNPTFLELDVRLAMAESDTERDAIAAERLSLLHEGIDTVVTNLRFLQEQDAMAA